MQIEQSMPRVRVGGQDAVSDPSGKPVASALADLFLSGQRYYLMTLDLVVAFGSFTGSALLSPFGGLEHNTTQQMTIAAVFAGLFVTLGLGMGLYERSLRFRARIVWSIGFLSACGALAGTLAFNYLTFYSPMGRLTFLYGALGSLAGTMGVRSTLSWFFKNYPYRFTILGGQSQCTREIRRFCQGHTRDACYYSLVEWERDLFPPGVVPSAQGLLKARASNVVLTRGALGDSEKVELAMAALQSGCSVIDEVDFYCQVFERLPIDELSRHTIIQEGLSNPRVLSTVIKRVFDVFASTIGILITSPLMILLAILIRLESPGPILFVRHRVGRFCEPFRMLKFRTMYVPTSEAAADGSFTRINDRRVTRVGHWMRRLHLDELPQLFNIFTGRMSLVGARPEVLEFAARMSQQIPLYELRYLMRPGLTGHAQIHQGYAMDTVEDTKVKLSYDLYYLCNYNIFLDLRVILRTFFVLARRSR